MLLGSPKPSHVQDAFPARARQRHPPATAAGAPGYSLGSLKGRRRTKRKMSPNQESPARTKPERMSTRRGTGM